MTSTQSAAHAQHLMNLNSSVLNNARQPICEASDDFQLIKREVQKNFVLMTESQAVRIHKIAINEESAPELKEKAQTHLQSAYAPLALKTALGAMTTHTTTGLTLTAVYNCALIALWILTLRWDPKKGMTLGAFLEYMLPVEFQRQLKEETLVTPIEWNRIAVQTTLAELIGSPNQLHLTWYEDCEFRTTYGFRCSTMITWEQTNSGNLMTLRTPGETEEIPYFDRKGHQKFIRQGQPNPFLEWRHLSKIHPVKRFASRKEKKNYSLDELHTGYLRTELWMSRRAFVQNKRLIQQKRMIFARPARPLRAENITPRMIQDHMQKHRDTAGLPLDKSWTIHKIADLLATLHHSVSLDASVSLEDEGLRFSDLLIAPEVEDQDDDEMDEVGPRFSAEQFTDAADMVRMLAKSELLELALKIPLRRFLNAYREGRAGFCTLCSRFDVRVKHAVMIMQVIEAHLR